MFGFHNKRLIIQLTGIIIRSVKKTICALTVFNTYSNITNFPDKILNVCHSQLLLTLSSLTNHKV